MSVKIECRECGDIFEVYECRADSAKFCSNECYYSSIEPDKVEVSCSTCGTSISRRPSNLEGKDDVYCSRECQSMPSERYDPKSFACEECGSEFEKIPEISEQTSVCDNCTVRPGDVLLECEYCGDEFWAQSDSRKYCSRSCSGKSRTGKEAGNWQGGKSFEYECDYCGDSIQVDECNSDLDNHYCDEDCLAADRSKNVSATCKQCGQSYSVSPHRVERTNFCSNECLQDWQSENYTGPLHPRWKEDSPKSAYYGRNWIEQREATLERDSHECQRCGISSESSIEKFGIDLHVHHITPLRKFDDKEEANRLENLVSLCPSCHHIVEGTEDNGRAFQSKDDEQIPLPL